MLDDNLLFVEQTLPLLLEQDYGEFEVVVVDNGSSAEVVDALQRQQVRYNRLKCTRINPDRKFKTRRKLALTVGIKAATFPRGYNPHIKHWGSGFDGFENKKADFRRPVDPQGLEPQGIQSPH